MTVPVELKHSGRVRGEPVQAAPAEPRYAPLGFLVVRAPLLPVEDYLAHGDARSRTARDARIRESLAVGAPDLLAAADRGTDNRRDRARVDAKLLRYLIRMSTRPTPYGLFAGVALATWGRDTDVEIAHGSRRTRTRVDMEWLLRWKADLESRPDIRRQLNVTANTAAFGRADRLYLPGRASSLNQPVSGEVSVRSTPVVERALHAARRPMAFADLVGILLEEFPNATTERVETVLTTLCTQEFLLTDLRPPLTTADPASHILHRLAGVPEAAAAREELHGIVESLKDWDVTRPADGGETYRQLASRALAVLDSKIDTPFQVDSALPLGGTRVTTAVAGEAARAAELLIRLSPMPRGNPALAGYRAAFEARYGTTRRVPLLELLDAELGLGPPERYQPRMEALADQDGRRQIRREQTLIDLALGALHERRSCVELDDDALSRLETWTPATGQAPLTLDINVFVAAKSSAALDSGDFRLIVGPNLGAQHAGQMLGRFADLLGPPAVAALEEVAGIEAATQAGIHAELVYLPDPPRGANVTIRPAVRSHEIVFAVAPGVRPDCVIPLDEILVGIEHRRFVLRWSTGNIPIRVHAGHMLNARGAPAICRLLTEIADDGVTQFSAFNWGPAERFPFLPRVQSGRIILRPAEWHVSDRTRAAWLQSQSAIALGEMVSLWREEWQVPQYVYLGQGDNRLLLDLDCAAHVAELRTELRRLRPEDAFAIQEALPRPDEHWLRGPDGHYASELVVPLALRSPTTSGKAEVSSQAVEAVPHVPARPETSRGTRLRSPGSEWLYAKLYCGPSTADDLIAAEVRPFLETLRSADPSDEWFFVRYADEGGFHIRLRIKSAPERLIQDAFPALCAWGQRLIDNGVCTRFAFDTYEREIERYGGAAGLDAAELIFGADSRAAASILDLVRRHILQLDQTTLAVISIDELLASFGLDESARRDWCTSHADAHHVVGPDYRTRKVRLRALLADPRSVAAEPGGEALLRAFAERHAAIAPLADRLRELATRNELEESLSAIFRSLVHLHCNRLFSGDQSAEPRFLGLLSRTREGLARTA